MKAQLPSAAIQYEVQELFFELEAPKTLNSKPVTLRDLMLILRAQDTILGVSIKRVLAPSLGTPINLSLVHGNLRIHSLRWSFFMAPYIP